MKRKCVLKYAVLALSLILLLPSSLFCAGEPEAVQGPDLSRWGKIDWQQFKGTSINVLATSMPVAEIYKEKIRQFEELTGIKVNFELLGDVDRRKKQLIDFSSHMAEYDVGNIGFANREEFAIPGYLEPLEKYIADPKLTDGMWYNFDDYPDDIIASGYSKGDLVFLPFTAEYFLLWYRKDIFKKLNLQVPKNFNDLQETAAKLKEAREAGKITEYSWVERAMPGAGESGWNLFCTANRMGGFNFIEFDKNITHMNTPEGKQMMEFYTSMLMDYAPPGSGNWTWGDIAVAFKTKQVAMTTGGNASYTYLEDPKESQVAGMVGYAPPPMEPGGKDPLWVWGWGINKDSRNKGAAWLFVQWATSPALMEEMAPLYGCPARKSVYSNENYIKAMPSKEFIEAQLFMMTKGVNPYSQLIHEKYAEGADIVSKEMSYIISDIKTIDQALADGEEQLMKLGYQKP